MLSGIRARNIPSCHTSGSGGAPSLPLRGPHLLPPWDWAVQGSQAGEREIEHGAWLYSSPAPSSPRDEWADQLPCLQGWWQVPVFLLPFLKQVRSALLECRRIFYSQWELVRARVQRDRPPETRYVPALFCVPVGSGKEDPSAVPPGNFPTLLSALHSCTFLSSAYHSRAPEKHKLGASPKVVLGSDLYKKESWQQNASAVQVFKTSWWSFWGERAIGEGGA